MEGDPTPRSAQIAAWAVLLALLGLSAAVMLPAALAVPFDFSVSKLFVKDGSDQAHLRSIQERFTENDRNAVIMLTPKSGDWFDPKRLEALNDLHQRVANMPVKEADQKFLQDDLCSENGGLEGRAFELVQSLAQATVFRRRQQSVQIEMLREETGYGSYQRNREELLGHPLLKGRLISADGRSTLVFARIHCALQADGIQKDYLADLRSLIVRWQSDHPGIEAQTTGIPFIQNDIIRTMRAELASRQPFVGLGMVVFLWLAFRRFRYAVLPFLSVSLASLWWLGLVKLTGGTINIINFSTVTVILVIGVGDAIHLVARVEEGLDEGLAPWSALKKGWRAMLPAITLTTITTVIGFASLGVARVQLVRNYGSSAAVGIALACFFTLSVVPALLLLAPPKPGKRRLNKKLWLNNVALPFVSRLVRARFGQIALCSAALLLISGLFAGQIKPFSRALEEVRAEHPAQIALNDLEQQFSGTMPFDVVLEGPRSALLSPDNLARMSALQDRLDQSPAGVKSLSIVDLLGGLHGLWDQGKAGDRSSLPKNKAQIEALLALLNLDSDELTEPYLDDPATETASAAAESEAAEHDEEFVLEEEGVEPASGAPQVGLELDPNRIIALRIAAIKKDTGSTVFAGEIDRIEATLAGWPAPIKGELTGASKLANQAVEAVVIDMMSSLALAFGLITLVFMLVLGSWRQGLLAMIPNILPLVVTMGIMALSGLSLRISTVIIFAMCMGVVVDDTIHFLVRFRQERLTQDFESSLDTTILHAGRPVVFTTMMLAMGFSLLITSEFNGMRDFGRLSALCICLALVADLLTLPALLMLGERWRQRGAKR